MASKTDTVMQITEFISKFEDNLKENSKEILEVFFLMVNCTSSYNASLNTPMLDLNAIAHSNMGKISEHVASIQKLLGIFSYVTDLKKEKEKADIKNSNEYMG